MHLPVHLTCNVRIKWHGVDFLQQPVAYLSAQLCNWLSFGGTAHQDRVLCLITVTKMTPHRYENDTSAGKSYFVDQISVSDAVCRNSEQLVILRRVICAFPTLEGYQHSQLGTLRVAILWRFSTRYLHSRFPACTVQVVRGRTALVRNPWNRTAFRVASASRKLSFNWTATGEHAQSTSPTTRQLIRLISAAEVPSSQSAECTHVGRAANEQDTGCSYQADNRRRSCPEKCALHNS